jgi:hypothetical protein
MTVAQQNKMNQINPVLYSFENLSGDLVIYTTYGTKKVCMLFIGKRGGFSGRTRIYESFDTETKKPFGYIRSENP